MGSGIKLDGLPHVMLYDDEGNFTILGKAVDMRQGISFDQCCNSTRVNFDLDFNYWKENCPGTNEFHPEKSPEHEMARRAAKKMLYGDESAGYEHKFPADDPTYFSTDVTRACYEGKYELVDINTTNCGVDIYDILGFKKPVSFDVKEVIYNDPAVVVYWKDGTAPRR